MVQRLKNVSTEMMESIDTSVTKAIDLPKTEEIDALVMESLAITKVETINMPEVAEKDTLVIETLGTSVSEAIGAPKFDELDAPMTSSITTSFVEAKGVSGIGEINTPMMQTADNSVDELSDQEAKEVDAQMIKTLHTSEPKTKDVLEVSDVDALITESLDVPKVKEIDAPMTESIDISEAKVLDQPEIKRSDALITESTFIAKVIEMSKVDKLNLPIRDLLNTSVAESEDVSEAEMISDPMIEVLHTSTIETVDIPETKESGAPMIESLGTTMVEAIDVPETDEIYAQSNDNNDVPVTERSSEEFDKPAETESIEVVKIKEEIIHIPHVLLDNTDGEHYQTDNQNEMNVFYETDKTLSVKDEPSTEDDNENIDGEENSLPILIGSPFHLDSNHLPKSQIVLEYPSDKLGDPPDEITVKEEISDAEFHETYIERDLEDNVQMELQDHDKSTIKEETADQQELLELDSNITNDDAEDISKEFTEVVPVSLKSNTEFQLSNGKLEMEMMLTKGASEVETIVPSENLLAQISGARESKELILGYRGDDHTKLRELNEDIGDLLAPRGFECLLCNRRYQSMSTFQRHQKTHNAILDVPKEPVTEIEEPICLIEDIEAKDGVYSCNCGKAFRRKSSVLSCMRAHRNAGLGCHYCSQVFTRRDDLRRHCRLKHASIIASKYRCNVCSKTFSGRKALARHGRTHTVKKKLEEPPAPVELVAEVLPPPEVIQIDEVDEEPKPKTKKSPVKFKFTCRECGKGYATLGQLTHHKAQHKNKNKFQCDRCEENMSCRSELSSHRRLHCRGYDTTNQTTRTTRATLLSQPAHVVQPVQYACDVCARPFPTQDLMQRHKATHPFVIFTKDDSTHTQIFFK